MLGVGWLGLGLTWQDGSRTLCCHFVMQRQSCRGLRDVVHTVGGQEWGTVYILAGVVCVFRSMTGIISVLLVHVCVWVLKWFAGKGGIRAVGW
jgi:hypothetical protein